MLLGLSGLDRYWMLESKWTFISASLLWHPHLKSSEVFPPGHGDGGGPGNPTFHVPAHLLEPAVHLQLIDLFVVFGACGATCIVKKIPAKQSMSGTNSKIFAYSHTLGNEHAHSPVSKDSKLIRIWYSWIAIALFSSLFMAVSYFLT